MIKINKTLTDNLATKAQSTTRRRLNHNFHEDFRDPINRMLNTIEPGSYIQPHKHEDPDKREIFIILNGRIAVIEFNNDGTVADYLILDPKIGNFGVEIIPGTWHTIISLEEKSVVYEIKDGPYEPVSDKNFAPWAPKESDTEASAYLKNLIEKLKLQ